MTHTQGADTSKVSGGSRQRWILAGKLAFTLAAVAFLVSRVDVVESANVIRRAAPGWLALALVARSLPIIVSTHKWNRLLRALGIEAPRWTLLKVYTIGQFISSFMPGIVGGDVVRWHLVGKTTGGRLKVAATILLERVTGLVALTVLCAVAVAWDRERIATAPVLAGLAAVSAAMVVGLVLALNRRLAVPLTARTRHTRLRQVVRPLHKLHRTLRTFPRKPLVGALGDSCLFYLSCGVTFYFICNSLGMETTFVEATVVQLLICMITLLPISLGGVGVVQVGDVYLLGLLGVDAPTALSASVIRLLMHYAYSLLGGALFVRWKDRPALGSRADAT